MDREEELTRRLCKYLGVSVLVYSRGIRLVPVVKPGDFAVAGLYNSWHDALFGCFGQFGLCDLQKWLFYKGPWLECKNKAFPFSSLDELELQLSIKGF